MATPVRKSRKRKLAQTMEDIIKQDSITLLDTVPTSRTPMQSASPKPSSVQQAHSKHAVNPEQFLQLPGSYIIMHACCIVTRYSLAQYVILPSQGVILW